jgi:transcriptional regulator GlxA family with amidase domain
MLREAGVAEVHAVASRAGPVDLMPALRVLADQTIEAFDREVPEGADIVIVPAMHRQDDPVILDFLRRQADRGALVVSICDGAMTVASAGIFDGRRATGHWYSFNALARSHPETIWVRDAQIVVDGPVMSTTGVSASVPAALMLIETLPIARPQNASPHASMSRTGAGRTTAMPTG